MEVTGYKTGVWLVKTVGAILIAVAVCLYLHLLVPTDVRPAIALASLTAIAFIALIFTMRSPTSYPIFTSSTGSQS
jgi:hypothetical protein